VEDKILKVRFLFLLIANVKQKNALNIFNLFFFKLIKKFFLS